MLVGVIAKRVPEVDAVDLAMTFLTGMFGLLAIEDAPLAARRRRLDLLVRIASQGAMATEASHNGPDPSINRRVT